MTIYNESKCHRKWNLEYITTKKQKYKITKLDKIKVNENQCARELVARDVL